MGAREIVVRIGTAAEIAANSALYAEGELLFSTDEHNLYASIGSDVQLIGGASGVENIGDIQDVTQTSLDDGEVLMSSSDVWINQTLTEAGIVAADGTVPLTANWDAGSYKITALTFESDQTTGTAPLTVASTTVVTNLNADTVDAKHSTDFLLLDGSQAMAGNFNMSNGAYDILIPNAQAAALEIAEGANAYLTFNTTVGGTFVTLGKRLTAGSFSSPMDVGSTRQYGIEAHYSGNNYDVTGIRSRAQLVTTDASTKTAQGALIQAANNDNVDAGVLNGAHIEAIGKATSNAATISTMRGLLVRTEWSAKDTVTTMHTLDVRTHTRDAATEGYISGDGYAIYIENEAVGGNGQALDAGIYFKGTNISGGNDAFATGIDFSGATYTNPEIKLLSGGTIGAGGGIAIDANNEVTFKETAGFDAEFDNGNSSTADTIDWGVGNKQKSTLTGNCTYTFTAPNGPCAVQLKVIQDGTGSRTVTWPATVKWGTDGAPTLTTTANYYDLIFFYYDGTNYLGGYKLGYS